MLAMLGGLRDTCRLLRRRTAAQRLSRHAQSWLPLGGELQQAPHDLRYSSLQKGPPLRDWGSQGWTARMPLALGGTSSIEIPRIWAWLFIKAY